MTRALAYRARRFVTGVLVTGALVTAVLAMVSTSVPRAHAQSDSSASMTGAARDLFQEGVRAGREGRWEEARTAFERSYELSPRDATLLNLATALGETGRLVAAIEAYRRFLARADARTRAQGGEAAERAIATLEARLAHVAVSTRGLGDDDQVLLDGEPITRAAMGLDLPLDPGPHVITIERDGQECARRALELAESQHSDLELVAVCPELPAEETEIPVAPPPPEDPTPWIVLGVAGGVAVVAGVVIAVVVATLPGDPGPFVGNVGPGMFTLP